MSRREAVANITGSLDPGSIHEIEQRVPESVILGMKQVHDVTGMVSDALDGLGVRGCVPASFLVPTIQGSTIVGPALTFRHIPSRGDPYANASKKSSRMVGNEVHYHAKPGDVLVIQGVVGASSMGANSARDGQTQGEVGAIVDGSIRDVASSRANGYPIWAREVTPITGKWRVDGVEINGIVTIAGIQVAPGDLVVADDSGVCFVPKEHAVTVLELCLVAAQAEKDSFSELDPQPR